MSCYAGKIGLNNVESFVWDTTFSYFDSEMTSSILTKFSESKRSSMDNMLSKFRCLEIVAMETITNSLFF